MKKVFPACLLLVSFLAVADESPIGVRKGTIVADVLNVRARPGLFYEILCKLKEGDSVSVVAENDEWYEIAAPAESQAWLSSDYVSDQGLVTGDGVRIRAGAGVAFTPYHSVDRGASVTTKGDPRNGWQQILVPDGATAWASKEFIRVEVPEIAVADPTETEGDTGTEIAVADPAETEGDTGTEVAVADPAETESDTGTDIAVADPAETEGDTGTEVAVADPAETEGDTGTDIAVADPAETESDTGTDTAVADPAETESDTGTDIAVADPAETEGDTGTEIAVADPAETGGDTGTEVVVADPADADDLSHDDVAAIEKSLIEEALRGRPASRDGGNSDLPPPTMSLATREGKIVSLDDQASDVTTHALVHQKDGANVPVCFLHSDRVNIKEWEDQPVRVYGTEVWYTGWKNAVIEVQGIVLRR